MGDEGDKKGLPSARMMLASGLKVCSPYSLFAKKVAKSNVADNIGYRKNEKTRYGCT
jgi:hypothetical protein